MSTFPERFSAWVLKRRPVTHEEFAEVADWVNEGGALDPAGPPGVSTTDGDDPAHYVT